MSFFEKILESVLAADGSESSVGDFSHRLHDVLYSVVSSFGVNNSIVNACIDVHSNVIFRKNELAIQVNDSEQ